MFIRNPVTNEWEEVFLPPTGDTLPIGGIMEFGGSVEPTNWLFCNGQAVSRTDYKELFEAIGTTYGDGDGSTTFNVPDFSSRSPMGVGTGTDGTNSETTTLGQEKGEYKHKLTVGEMPEHSHNIGAEGAILFGGNRAYFSSAGSIATWAYNDRHSHTSTKGGGQTHNTIHPVLGVNYIIKAKQSIGIVGTVSEDITDTNNNAVPNAKTVKDYVDSNNEFVPLWTGSELPAGKTYSLANNIYNYRFVVIVAEWGNKITIPIIEGNTYLFGGCNYIAGSGTAIVTCGLSANITDSGNKVSITALKTILHNQSSNHGTLENPKLLGIYGVR